MGKILFLMGTYKPHPSANGLCVDKIVKELKECGYEITVLTTNVRQNKNEEIINGVKIYRIDDEQIYTTEFKKRKDSISNLIRLKYKLISFFHIFFRYPYSSNRVRSFKSILKTLNGNKYDAIIFVVQPVETLKLLSYTEAIFPDSKRIIYSLDLINEKRVPKELKKLLEWQSVKLYLESLKHCDYMINMLYSESYFKNMIYDDYRNKIIYADIPSFSRPIINNSFVSYNDNYINIVYVGSLDRIIRNPEKVLGFFEKISTKKFILHFYSKGCEEILEKYKSVFNNQLVLHGFVTSEEAQNAVLQADILLNISNNTAYQVPSKIFEYFSTGKPVLTFLTSKNDKSVPYYEKYPNSILINEDYTNIELKRVSRLFDKTQTHTYDYEEIVESFNENTPQYTSNIIKKCINSR